MYPKTFYHLGDAQCHHLTHTTLHVFLYFDCWQLSHLQLQLFLAEAQHMEGRGSGVGTVRVGMSSSRYGRGIIHVTGCHEVTPTTYVYNVLTKCGQTGVN